MDKHLEVLTKEMIQSYKWIFHESGWTGLPICESKAHITEEELVKLIPKDCYSKTRVVHTKNDLKVFQKANKDEVYHF
jgi:hypothetical protein